MTFQPGHKRYGGRVKGKPNRYSSDIRSAMLAAGAELGGKTGLKGFFLDIGKKNPRVLGTWIASLLPREFKVDGDGQPSMAPTVNLTVVGVASGTHLSRDECESLIRGELPPPPLLELEAEAQETVDEPDDAT